jgi:TPR repeat protein
MADNPAPAAAPAPSIARNQLHSSPARPGEDAALLDKAEAYLYGNGARQNCAQALVYLRTAADRGNAKARSQLGGLYATGHCVSLDRARAYYWFTLATDAGEHNEWVEHNREMLWAQMSPGERERISRH